MLTAKKALAASRVYTEETAIGMGALKGANCIIKSIVKTGDLNTVTFEWTDTEGGKHESTMLVYDGAPGTPGQDGDDGFSPTIVVKSSTSTEYILTITDKNGSYDTPNLKGSGGGGGASAMSDLTDVDLTALANGSVLVYDSTSAKWEATALSLSDISGIDLTGITDGQILAWDAANNKFVPADNTGEEYTAGEGIEISQDNEISSKIVMYTGTKAAWDALPLADKIKNTHASFTDDTQSGIVDNVPTENSDNLVKSGGVWSGLESKADVTDLNTKADIATTLAGYGITDAYTKTETDNAITAEIEKLDVSDAAVAGSYVTEVSEADGKISVVREAADAAPTESSNKMVKSGGVYAALEDKADKVSSATNGNFVGLDASGNLTDSGKKASDFATAQGLADEAATRSAMGAKNLLRFPYETTSYSILTVEDDGGLTLNGTPTTDFWIAINNNSSDVHPYVLPAGRYVFSCKRVGNVAVTLGVRTIDGDESLASMYFGNEDYVETTFELAEATDLKVRGFIGANTACDGTIYPMIRLATDADTTYQPYAKTNKELTAENGALTNKTDVLMDNGAVNLLPNYVTPFSSGGADVAVASDGIITVTASGALTGNCNIYPVNNDNGPVNERLYLPKGNYVGSGCPSGGTNNSYYIDFYDQTNGARLGYDYGEGVQFTLANDTWIIVRISVRSGYTISGSLVFKPMITDAALGLSYADYQPYAKTNRQLTQDSVTWDNISEVGAVNLFDNKAKDRTDTGTSWVVNDDKTVTATVTAAPSSQLVLDCFNASQVSANQLSFDKPVKISGCPSGGTNTTYTLSVQLSTQTWIPETGEGVIIPANTKINRIVAVVSTGITAGTYTFKPMITDPSYNGPYVPYAKTNRELMEDVGDISDYLEALKGYTLSDFNAKPANVPFVNYVGNASEWANPITDAGTQGGALVWLGRYDNSAVRLSQLFLCNTSDVYIRQINASSINGTWTYSSWKKITASSI